MKSNTCPRCKAHMQNVIVCWNGTLLQAICESCNWTGTKRKKGN